MPRPRLCRGRAVAALDGVGDPTLGEWHECSGAAFHLRRRLTDAEQQRVGPVVDVRRTAEAARRGRALGGLLRHVPAHVLAEEIGDHHGGHDA